MKRLHHIRRAAGQVEVTSDVIVGSERLLNYADADAVHYIQKHRTAAADWLTTTAAPACGHSRRLL